MTVLTVLTDGVGTAAAAKPVVTGLGGAFMISSEAKAAGKDGGYRGWQLYVAGRAGVLGDVGVEVVDAALGFLHPDLVRQGWEGGLAVAPLPETVARYVEACRAWGRSRYAGLAEADLLRLVRAAAGGHRGAADPAGPGGGGHRRPGRTRVRRARRPPAGRPAAAARRRGRRRPIGSLSGPAALSARRAVRFRVTLEHDDFCLRRPPRPRGAGP